MLKKRFEKTEILYEEFLEKLEEEIQKKYPYNAKKKDNIAKTKIIINFISIFFLLILLKLYITSL